MATETWELYLDESGEFEDRRLRSNWNPSLVGGLLCTEGAVTAGQAERLCGGQRLHANEDQSEAATARNFDILRTLRQDERCRFVFFENTERLMIVNGDITYLNIVAEGLVRLLRDLAAAKKEQVIALKVCIALRNNMERKNAEGVSVDLEFREYEARLQERMVFAMGGESIPNASYSISFASARRDSRLMLADLICNYYQTRTAPKKFTPAQRDELQTKLFDAITLYPVFEQSTARMSRRLLAEDSIGDAMVVMASARTTTPTLVSALVSRLKSMSARERELHFRRVALQIGVYVDKRLFEVGRRFAERYRERLLTPMAADKDIGGEVGRWLFDTDFYLLTMADHMGDARGCELYGKRCRENIGIVLQGWEQLDYYFNFCIRENNVLMGCFDFDGVLSRTARLETLADECHALAELVREDMGIESEMRSISIGKLMGQRVEAYANLLGRLPGALEDALKASDQALKVFRAPEDRQRQLQYRAALYLRVHKPEKALPALSEVPDVGGDIEAICEKYLNKAEKKPDAARAFDWMHYGCVMKAFIDEGDARGLKMGELLTRQPAFARALASEKLGGHPWQIICWHLACWYLASDRPADWERYSKRAVSIARQDQGFATMRTFELCISADRLLKAKKIGGKTEAKAQTEYDEILREWREADVPDTMRAWFEDPIAKNALAAVADAWLR